MCSKIEPGPRPKQNIQNEAGPMETDNARSTIYTRSNSRIIASVPNPECSSAPLESSLQSPILCLFRSRRSVLQLFILSGLKYDGTFSNSQCRVWSLGQPACPSYHVTFTACADLPEHPKCLFRQNAAVISIVARSNYAICSHD
jgi:hypothetical protein